MLLPRAPDDPADQRQWTMYPKIDQHQATMMLDLLLDMLALPSKHICMVVTATTMAPFRAAMAPTSLMWHCIIILWLVLVKASLRR